MSSRPRRIAGVLFDLDGTLVDNMRFHVLAWQKMAAAFGVALEEARFQREFAGRTNQEIIPMLLGAALTTTEVKELAQRKEALYRELYKEHVAFVPGAESLIEALRRNRIKVAIASAAPPRNRTMVLRRLALNDRLDAVVGAEDVERGKPFPDLFLLAASRVGVAPSDCVVFEDAELGVRAAVAAGASVAGITTLETASHLVAAGATWTMPDYRSLPRDLAELLGV